MLATLLNTSMWIYKYPCKQNIACRHFFMNVPQRNRITRGLLSTIVRIVIHIENNIESSNGSGITQKTKPDFGFLNIHIFFVFTNLFFIFDDFFPYPHFLARLHIKTWKSNFGWCPIYCNSQALPIVVNRKKNLSHPTLEIFAVNY